MLIAGIYKGLAPIEGGDLACQGRIEPRMGGQGSDARAGGVAHREERDLPYAGPVASRHVPGDPATPQRRSNGGGPQDHECDRAAAFVRVIGNNAIVPRRCSAVESIVATERWWVSFQPGSGRHDCIRRPGQARWRR
jgi:hypothetical protein